jgi:hypothetical protein
MDKVQETSGSQCYIPSSKPFSNTYGENDSGVWKFNSAYFPQHYTKYVYGGPLKSNLHYGCLLHIEACIGLHSKPNAGPSTITET